MTSRGEPDVHAADRLARWNARYKEWVRLGLGIGVVGCRRVGLMRDLDRKIDRRKPKKRGRRARVPWRLAGALVVTIVLVVALVLLVGGGEQESDRVSPSSHQRVGPLEVSATRIDVGQVPLGQWVNPTFRLRNVSTEPVTITIPQQGVEPVQGC